MLKILNRNLRRLCFRLRWRIRRRSKPKVVIKSFGKSDSRAHSETRNQSNANGSVQVHPNGELDGAKSQRPIRIATFNAALFSMAPAVPEPENPPVFEVGNGSEDCGTAKNAEVYSPREKLMSDRPKSILKQSPLHPSTVKNQENLSKQQKFEKSKLRVSINLPDNEISLKRSGRFNFFDDEKEASSSSSGGGGGGGVGFSRAAKGKAPMRPAVSFSSSAGNGFSCRRYSSTRTIVEVLRELNADVLALQDVRAEEEKSMKPLSDLAGALGMNYVFAESWAPGYGNAVLSKWPIKRWKVQKICDDTDFRNVLKVTIDVAEAGEVNLQCTHLDHLDENWRMKQINAIIQSNQEEPHILAGGLNSLDQTDYSEERWSDIVKYYEEMGKPTPKVEVMKFLKSRQYADAKDFSGECESVVMIAKGQNVQGTCKYGTRVDYILASPKSPYKFIPGSYSVCSSKGTSDHHIVKVDFVKVDNPAGAPESTGRRQRRPKQRIVKITNSSPTKGIFGNHRHQ